MKKTNKIRHIFLIGNVGSGKSTAMPVLKKGLKAKLLRADELFQTACPFRKEFLKDMSRWGFANELWLTFERAKMLRLHLKKNKDSLTIIDSGLLMSWVYTYSHYLEKKITKHEWELYSKIYDHLVADLVKDFMVVNFSYSFDTLFKRIKKRGRDYEVKGYDIKYLKQLEKGLLALKEKLKKDKIKFIDILEKNIPDFEKDKKNQKILIDKVKNGISFKA